MYCLLYQRFFDTIQQGVLSLSLVNRSEFLPTFSDERGRKFPETTASRNRRADPPTTPVQASSAFRVFSNLYSAVANNIFFGVVQRVLMALCLEDPSAAYLGTRLPLLKSSTDFLNLKVWSSNITAFWFSELVYQLKSKNKERTHTKNTMQGINKVPFLSPCFLQVPETPWNLSVWQSWPSTTSTREAARCRLHGQLHLQLLIVLRVGYASIMSLQGEFNNFGWAPPASHNKISGDY